MDPERSQIPKDAFPPNQPQFYEWLFNARPSQSIPGIPPQFVTPDYIAVRDAQTAEYPTRPNREPNTDPASRESKKIPLLAAAAVSLVVVLSFEGVLTPDSAVEQETASTHHPRAKASVLQPEIKNDVQVSTPAPEVDPETEPTVAATPLASPPTLAPPAVPNVEHQPTDTALYQTYRVGTLNVFNTHLSEMSEQEDIERNKAIARTINSYDPLIFELQEVNEVSGPVIRRNLDEKYSTTPSYVNGHFVDSMTVYNKEVLKPVQRGPIVFSKMGIDNGFDANRTRTSAWTLFQIRGTTKYLRSLNMHADTNPNGRIKDAHSILEVMQRAAQSGPGEDDVINMVIGDANSNKHQENRSQIYKILTASGQFTLMGDVAKELVNPNCDTHNGYDGKQDCRENSSAEGSQIDQLYVESGSVDSSSVVVSKYANYANNVTAWLSDHNPVVAFVRFFTRPS